MSQAYNPVYEKAQYEKNPEKYDAMLDTLEYDEAEWYRRYDRNYFGNYNDLRRLAEAKTRCQLLTH